MAHQPVLINVVLTTLQGDGCALLCPMCWSDLVHPVRLACTGPGRMRGLLKLDSDGVHIDHTIVTPPADRVLVLLLQCVNGHAFSYGLRMERGQAVIERHVHAGLKGGALLWQDSH